MNLTNRAFANFIRDQDDLILSITERVETYSLVTGIFSGDKQAQDMLTSVMLVAMKLYREWLLAHGIKGIPEMEKRLSSQTKSN